MTRWSVCGYQCRVGTCNSKAGNTFVRIGRKGKSVTRPFEISGEASERENDGVYAQFQEHRGNFCGMADKKKFCNKKNGKHKLFLWMPTCESVPQFFTGFGISEVL